MLRGHSEGAVIVHLPHDLCQDFSHQQDLTHNWWKEGEARSRRPASHSIRRKKEENPRLPLLLRTADYKSIVK